MGHHPTLASWLTWGLFGNWTSVAFRMVFSSKMAAWDKLWPKGWKADTELCRAPNQEQHTSKMHRTHLFTIKTLIKYDSHRPNIYFGGYFGGHFSHHEALGWQIPAQEMEQLSNYNHNGETWRQWLWNSPIGASTLWGQVHTILWTITLIIHDLAQAKISDFYLPTDWACAKEYVSCKDENQSMKVQLEEVRRIGVDIIWSLAACLPGLRS